MPVSEGIRRPSDRRRECARSAGGVDDGRDCRCARACAQGTDHSRYHRCARCPGNAARRGGAHGPDPRRIRAFRGHRHPGRRPGGDRRRIPVRYRWTEPHAMPRDDGSWLLSGAMPADEMAEQLGISLPSKRDYQTVAGFLLAELRHLPSSASTSSARLALRGDRSRRPPHRQNPRIAPCRSHPPPAATGVMVSIPDVAHSAMQAGSVQRGGNDAACAPDRRGVARVRRELSAGTGGARWHFRRRASSACWPFHSSPGCCPSSAAPSRLPA